MNTDGISKRINSDKARYTGISWAFMIFRVFADGHSIADFFERISGTDGTGVNIWTPEKKECVFRASLRVLLGFLKILACHLRASLCASSVSAEQRRSDIVRWRRGEEGGTGMATLLP